MTTHQLVRTEHLNQYGFLFGGQMLAWVDEAVGIAVRLDYQDAEFVTVGMDDVAFRLSVALGSVLSFHVEQVARGTTSITYKVNVTLGALGPHSKKNSNAAQRGDSVFVTKVTLVCIHKDGSKRPLPPL